MQKNYAIITDGKKAGVHQAQTLKMYSTVQDRLHVDAVTAAWHAAKHGQPDLLTRLMNGLNRNDQSALRLWLRRVHAIIGLDGENPDGKHSDVVKSAVKAGEVVDVENDRFYISVKGGHQSDQAKAMVKLLETRLINPAAPDTRVFDRSNFVEVQTLGDMDALKGILAAVKRLTEPNDRREIHLSPKVSKLLAEFAEKAEYMKNQTELAEADQAEKPKRRKRETVPFDGKPSAKDGSKAKDKDQTAALGATA